MEIKRLAALLSSESFNKLMHDLNRHLFEMVHGTDPAERLAAVLAIGRLAEQATDETMSNLTRYANYVRTLLPGKDVAVTRGAAVALSKLVSATSGTPLAGELVEYEFGRCIQWVDEKNDFGMLAAMYIFGEMVIRAPQVAFPYISTLLDLTWTVLLSNKVSSSVNLRNAAAEALRVLLLCLKERTDELILSDHVKRMVESVLEGIKNSNSAQMGGLLALRLLAQIFPGALRTFQFEDACEVALRLSSTKDTLAKTEAFELVAEMAALDKQRFAESYLASWTTMLVEIIGKKDKERCIALKALKHTIDALGEKFEPSAEPVTRALRHLLLLKGGASSGVASMRRSSIEEALVMECVAAMARALKDNYSSMVHALLPALLSGELNAGMRLALQAVVDNVPNSMPLIEDRLLASAGACLSRNEREISDDATLVVFACETIARFRYCGPVLETSVGEDLFRLLDLTSREIRMAAALAIAHLVKKPLNAGNGEEYYESFPAAIRAATRLMVLAASDPDFTLRAAVLEALNDSSLDFYLSATEPFHLLLMVLSSGPLPCRLQAISIVERITRSNTGLIYPHFRAILLQILADLGCAHPKSIAEEAAIVLSEVARLNATLVRPTVEPLLRALSPRLLDNNPNTATAVLVTLGRLVQVNSTAFNSHALSLVDSVSRVLGDQSSSKRRLAALGFLCTLLRNVDRSQIPSDRIAALLLETAELLKIELVRPVRNEAIKLIGVIGALDPYKLRTREMEQRLSGNDEMAPDFVDSLSPDSVGSSALGTFPTSTLSEEFYPGVTVAALLKLLRDGSLGRLHGVAVQALLAVFQSVGVKSAIYLPQVMPVLLKTIPPGDKINVPSLQEKVTYTLQALAAMVGAVGLHIRPFAEDLMQTVRDLWNRSELRMALIAMIRALADAMMGETLAEMLTFVPMVVSVLSPRSDSGLLTASLTALTSMAGYAHDHVHSIIAALHELLSDLDVPINRAHGDLVRRSLLLILELADCGDIRLDLPLIVHILNVIVSRSSSEAELRLVDRLACYLAINYAEEFYPLRRQFPMDRLPCVSKIITTNGTSGMDEVLGGLETISLSSSSNLADGTIVMSARAVLTTTHVGKLVMNEGNLRRSWDSFDCASKEDWFQWIRRFEAELLKESPAPSLRACAHLASKHYPLARELFNAAFVACWNELPDVLQDELVGSLESALASLTIPPEVMQIILNLAEFMERDDRPLPMDVATLGAYSMKCHAYAKALYYQEAEFQNAPSAAAVEALISVNSQIQQPDSATGVLVCAQKQHGIVLEESWYEKLQRWDDALAAYRARWERDPQSFDALLGIFRCWHALGDWDALNGLAAEVWDQVPSTVQGSFTPLAASAAWSVGDWDKMRAYIAPQSPTSLEGALFRAVLAIHDHAYTEAERHVVVTRELLDTELTAMISESYNRAYNTIVRAQTLTELEEVVQFCQGDARRQDIIKRSWSHRLDDCQMSVDVWQRILKIRGLVLPPEQAQERWIKFATLCRRSDRSIISRKILLGLLKANDLESLDLTQASSAVVYGFLKHNWESGDREAAVRYIRQYSKWLAQTVDRRLGNVQLQGGLPPGGREARDLEEQTKLLARCYLKLGMWSKTLAQERGEEIGPAIIESFLSATSYDKNWYKAWHGWALVNFEMATSYERRQINQTGGNNRGSVPRSNNPYLVPAIQGFFRSIGLSNGRSLQDSLRLLTLWFKYGTLAEVNAAIGDGFHTVPVDNWLQVIPQLIARIHVPSPQVRRLMHHLLNDIGKQHPQALIYPLTVASKSQSVARRTSALAILDKMRSHSAHLVEQAIMASQELIRVAILWEELWYEGLEEASKQYFGEHNVAAMLAILEPLHQLVHERPYETVRERAFLETYGGDLKEALEQCLRYKRTGNQSDISAAWDLYYQVFRRISKQLPQLGAIDLASVSPRLLAARDLDIAVPGTYRSGAPLVRIASFVPSIGVISSKQRPRKLVLIGSDGNRYRYLLKGHEDLRQDQRVMQLFGLVNGVLEADVETRKRHLTIERFAVVPLSQNTGLIGWVPHCDTLHSLIRDYREARGVLLSIEHRLMLQFAPDYDHLPGLNKIEAFQYALGNTDGRDLGRVMWQRSLTSELWLERRLAYTRSLAVMSMVGYILGLGDRHPSNLMIDQVSGRVVHIDFGDCFEVAMTRDKFPERVPFRLTRMLVKAMEVSGVEGSYRITAEHTMRVLRQNKDSLMAVLEAFVYDPLINWRLLARAESSMVKNGSTLPSSSALPSSSSGYNDIGGEEAVNFPENFSTSRRVRRDAEISRLEDESINRPEAVNAGALNVINRVSAKLTGRDFKAAALLDVASQVDRLIVEATAVENLCQAYVGWCAFW